MSEREGWPPVRGVGWIRIPGPPVERRTGDRSIDGQIQDLIEKARREPACRADCVSQAWALYVKHGSFGRRFWRETVGTIGGLVSGLIWFIVLALVALAFNSFWDAF